ncbi:MAG TPA: SIMPL domain-containing protein [Longimicrobiales bacterium]|nr:SIMPL domain-containing protein [Longimicrobiales bacterium]
MRTLIAAALMLVPAAAGAQVAPPQEQPRTLSVSAVGTVEMEPEQGVVLLAVESEATTAQEAAAANAQRMAQLMAALRQAGVADRQVRTTSYELRPEYSREPRGQEPPRITSYRAINMVQVTVDTVARMGGIIDRAISSGANRVANIHFQLRDPQAAHVEALAVAMRNARRQAEAIAAAAGERLGPPMSINTGGYSPAPPPMPYGRAEMAAMDVATPVEGGTLTVTAHVNVVYRLPD